jgi:hypothetical protein
MLHRNGVWEVSAEDCAEHTCDGCLLKQIEAKRFTERDCEVGDAGVTTETKWYVEVWNTGHPKSGLNDMWVMTTPFRFGGYDTQAEAEDAMNTVDTGKYFYPARRVVRHDVRETRTAVSFRD